MAVYSRSQDWVYKPLFEGQEGILVPLIASEADLSTVLVLNTVGAFIWEQLERPHSRNELESSITRSFDFDSPELALSLCNDVESYLGELVKMGALALLD